MSIIFQLYRADYLSQLDPDVLDALKQTVKDSFDRLQFVDLTRNTTLRASSLVDPGLRDQVVAKIQERARQVFAQLQPQPPSPIVPPGPLDLTKPLYPQLFDQQDLDNRLTPQQRDVLEMAISCEVTHFNGYVHLLTVREDVDKILLKEGTVTPPPPDTAYSPFNPHGPLYTLYNPSPP
jgi:hypothetical protein